MVLKHIRPKQKISDKATWKFMQGFYNATQGCCHYGGVLFSDPL